MSTITLASAIAMVAQADLQQDVDALITRVDALEATNQA